MDLNKVMFIGNLTRDPESRTIPSGAQVTSFSIAVNDRSRGRQNETTMFLKVEAWNKTAELCAQYLQKGAQVLVDGRLKIEEYTSREGEKRRDPVIVADRVSFGAKPRDAQGGGGYGGGGSQQGYGSQDHGNSGYGNSGGGYGSNQGYAQQQPPAAPPQQQQYGAPPPQGPPPAAPAPEPPRQYNNAPNPGSVQESAPPPSGAPQGTEDDLPF